MNQELKFRICYTAQNGQKSLIYSDNERFLITLDGKVLENYGNDKSPCWEAPFDVDEIPIIQQYTGLKDKNGKEIYEGDIIYHKNYKVYCQCIWDVERLTYRWVGKNVSLPIDTRDDNMTLKEKIVGNIFETPNLIK